ncbi:hypothetical protein EDD99_4473 [Streptomyces sp. 846.5]|nr:hypothetical protein EDD99_4473 [Streptomyces sp. 846.5]
MLAVSAAARGAHRRGSSRWALAVGRERQLPPFEASVVVPARGGQQHVQVDLVHTVPLWALPWPVILRYANRFDYM